MTMTPFFDSQQIARQLIDNNSTNLNSFHCTKKLRSDVLKFKWLQLVQHTTRSFLNGQEWLISKLAAMFSQSDHGGCFIKFQKRDILLYMYVKNVLFKESKLNSECSYYKHSKRSKNKMVHHLGVENLVHTV